MKTEILDTFTFSMNIRVGFQSIVLFDVAQSHLIQCFSFDLSKWHMLILVILPSFKITVGPLIFSFSIGILTTHV